MLEGVPDILDEGGPDVPVDHAVVERARQVHHVADHDLVVPDDRAIFDLVDAEAGDLGPVDDWARHDISLLPERRGRERAAESGLEGAVLLASGASAPL